MGGGHHLHPDRPRLPVPGRDHRLILARLARLAAAEHHEHGILCRGARRGSGALWPAGFNTDQGSQFTSAAFTGRLADAGIRISMDGRGRWLDKVFIERLWRSLKYEDVYLKG